VNCKKTEMGRACSRYRERSGTYMVLVGQPEGRNRLEDSGVDGRIILKWIFEKLVAGHRLH
jgi:hypothetical protein